MFLIRQGCQGSDLGKGIYIKRLMYPFHKFYQPLPRNTITDTEACKAIDLGKGAEDEYILPIPYVPSGIRIFAIGHILMVCLIYNEQYIFR